MSRAGMVAIASVALAAPLACASAPGGTPAAAGALEPAVVHFSYDAVKPQTVRIAGDGNLFWVNDTTDTRGIVVFPASIASAFRCADLRPYFTKVATVYRSLPITGLESEQVRLPCPLAPGSYDYEIWLMGAGFGGEAGDEPQQVLRAKIVVD